jgi:hypothetical protein
MVTKEILEMDPDPKRFIVQPKTETMTSKQKITLISAILIFGSLSFTACSGGGEGEKNSGEKAEKTEKSGSSKKKDSKELSGYICPMECEGEKTYDEKRDCPECGMELKPVEEVLEE